MVSFFWALVIFLQLREMSSQKKGGEGERQRGREGRGGREGGREGGEGEGVEGEGEGVEGRMKGWRVCVKGEFELTRGKHICCHHLGDLILLTFAEP